MPFEVKEVEVTLLVKQGQSLGLTLGSYLNQVRFYPSNENAAVSAEGLKWSNLNTRVDGLSPKTPAARCGKIKAGDTLAAINGHW